MTHLIAQYRETLKLGAPVTRGRLAMVQLLTEDELAPDYLTLDAALAAGHCQVQEVSENGLVNRLLLLNRAHLPILLLDGDLLVGAKQNRVLNLTLFAPAKAWTELPVSCVEQGRWSYRGGRAFGADLQVCSAILRATKAASVAANQRRGRVSDADQGAVWAEIRAKTARMGVRSDTQDITALCATHRELLAELVSGFVPLPGQVGALFTLDGRILGLDLFDCQPTLQQVLSRLARGYAIEALMNSLPEDTTTPADFLAGLRSAEVTLHPAPALGQVARIEAAGVAANALIHAGRVLHLFAYPRHAVADVFDP